MGTVIVVLFVVLIALVFISAMVNSVKKSTQRMRSRDKCEDCHARLKAANGVYAKTCAKCGHRQSWAPVP